MKRGNLGVCRWLFVVILSLAVLPGCVTKRYIPPEKRTGEPARLEEIAQSDENLGVSVDSLLFTECPGKWVKKALWDEYVLSVKNYASERVTISAIRLIDPRLVYVDRHIDPWELEKQSELLSKQYSAAGIGIAATAAPSLLIMTAGPMVALPMLPFVPIIAVAAPIAVLGNYLVWTKDREQIKDEFTKRQLGPLNSFTIAPGGTATGSIFVPIVPNPKALVVDYSVGTAGGQPRTLEVPLAKLEGLHVIKPGETPPASPKNVKLPKWLTRKKSGETPPTSPAGTAGSTPPPPGAPAATPPPGPGGSDTQGAQPEEDEHND